MSKAADKPTNGHGNGHASGGVDAAFPNSERVTLEGRDGVRVPARKITLTGGESPLYVYDTSGPQGHAKRDGRAVRRQGRLTRLVDLL